MGRHGRNGQDGGFGIQEVVGIARFTFEEYRKLAQRTSPDDGHDRIENAIFGLIGETGEIADLYKKWKYQSTPGTPMPRARILEEIGDVLWYLAELATGMGIGLDRAAAAADFEEFDFRIMKRRRAARNEDTPRIILAMSSEANAICYHARRSEWKMVEQKMRKMMVAAGTLAMNCGECTLRAARGNIEKPKHRYPDGFDARRSMERYE